MSQESNTQGQFENWDTVHNHDGDCLLIGRLVQNNGHHRDQTTYQVSYMDRDSKLVQVKEGLFRLGREANRSKSELRRLMFQIA